MKRCFLKKNSREAGFTFIEMLVYVSILTVISGTIVAFLFWAMRANARVKSLSEVQDNARRALEKISFEVRQAESVYAPTSVFDSSAGQLSIETKIDPPAGEDKTYKDFYLSDGILFFKKDGNSPEQLTSSSVRVTSLVFRNFNPSSPLYSVGMDITVEYNNPDNRAELDAKTSLSSLATLRTY